MHKSLFLSFFFFFILLLRKQSALFSLLSLASPPPLTRLAPFLFRHGCWPPPPSHARLSRLIGRGGADGWLPGRLSLLLRVLLSSVASCPLSLGWERCGCWLRSLSSLLHRIPLAEAATNWMDPAGCLLSDCPLPPIPLPCPPPA